MNHFDNDGHDFDLVIELHGSEALSRSEFYASFLDNFDCAGTFGCAGSVGGTFGTAGTFGCCC